jgi:hypothetical protein
MSKTFTLMEQLKQKTALLAHLPFRILPPGCSAKEAVGL